MKTLMLTLALPLALLGFGFGPAAAGQWISPEELVREAPPPDPPANPPTWIEPGNPPSEPSSGTFGS